MRVVGSEGLNKGVVYDIQTVGGDIQGKENLGGEYDGYEELAPEDDPAKTAIQVANAAVRGDYVGNPAVDPVEAAVLAGIEDPREVVHTNKAPAPVAAKAKGKASAKKDE